MAEGSIQRVTIVEDTLPAASEAHDRYLQPHQARQRPPTVYESLLGDAIERGFMADKYDLASLVEHLNQEGMKTPDGQAWTEQNYCDVMKQLGY